MPSIQHVVLIAGAAEGSYYKDIDLRHKLSEANSRSGISFGVFQFDASTNNEAKLILRLMIRVKFDDDNLNEHALVNLRKKAQLANPKKDVIKEGVGMAGKTPFHQIGARPHTPGNREICSQDTICHQRNH